MKLITITLSILLLAACSSEEIEQKAATFNKYASETAENKSPFGGLQKSLDKANNVEAMLQKSKDDRDAMMQQQLQ